ncbi:TPA: hypothetical protein ACKP7H_002313 [Serratia marcescens]
MMTINPPKRWVFAFWPLVFVASVMLSAKIGSSLIDGDRDVKKIFFTVMLTIALSGCGGDEQDAYDFAQKEITASTQNNEAVKFKDMKLVRVVKLSNGTSKGVVCGMSTNPNSFKGYKDFAVFYKTEVGAVSGKVNYVLSEKILPGQDERSVIEICR